MSDTGALIADRTARQLKRWYIVSGVLAYLTVAMFLFVHESPPTISNWVYTSLFFLATSGCIAYIVRVRVRGANGSRLFVDEQGIRLTTAPTGGWTLTWAEIGGVELRRRFLRPRRLADPIYGYELRLRLTAPADFFRQKRAGRRARDWYTAEIQLSETEAYAAQERARRFCAGPVRAAALPPAETGGPQQELIPPPVPEGTQSYWGDKPFGPYYLYPSGPLGRTSVYTTGTVPRDLRQFSGFVVTAIGVRWSSFVGESAWTRDQIASTFELTWAEIGAFRVSPHEDEYHVDIVPGDDRFAQRHTEMRNIWLRPDGTYRLDWRFTAKAVRDLRGFVERYHPGAYEEVNA